MTEHTPGPWEAPGDRLFHSVDAGWDEERHAYSRRVAEIPLWRRDDQRQADRKLIAAAPDFYAACDPKLLRRTAMLLERHNYLEAASELRQKASAEEGALSKAKSEAGDLCQS